MEVTLVYKGTRRYHYENYFKEMGGRPEGPDVICGPDWQVRFAPEEMVKAGPFSIPLNRITIIAEEHRLRELEDGFRKRFLTLGG